MTKITVKPRHVWGRQVKGGKVFIHRFDSLKDYRTWLFSEKCGPAEKRDYESANAPIIRKINRALAAGAAVTFPVEVGN